MGFLTQRHPAVFVTAGFFLIGVCQAEEGLQLLALSLLVSVASAWISATHFLRVLRRLKYVLMVIVVLFAWQTPGILMAPALGVWSPTYDGLRFALVPLLRLLCVAAVVAILREVLNTAEWVNGLHALSRPLGILGVSRDRLAIRLQLVLDYAEEKHPSWRSFLFDSSDDAVAGEVELIQMTLLDKCLVALLLSGLLGMVLW